MKRFNQALWVFHMVIGGAGIPLFVYAWGRMSAQPIAAPLFGAGILACVALVACSVHLFRQES